jgi:hypothetical protein
MQQTNKKMETYYLNTLIFFFKSQKERKYEAIEHVLRIIDQDKIPDKRRRKMLFRVLRRNGLNETTFKNGRFEPGSEEPQVHNNMQEPFPIRFPVQKMYIHLINGLLELPVPLN